MNKKKFIFLFLIFSTTPIFSQYYGRTEYCNSGDSLYSWALNGLKLREAPKTDTRVLITIPYGELLVVDSIVNEAIEIEMIEPIKIDDMWTKSYSHKDCMVKVRYKGYLGFVYKGFLSVLKPADLNEEEINSLTQYFKNNYAKLDSYTTDDYDLSVEEYIFKNRISYYSVYGRGCGGVTYVMPNILFQEGILLLKYFMSKRDFDKWYISSSIGKSTIEFANTNGMESLSIHKINNLTIISYNSCP